VWNVDILNESLFYDYSISRRCASNRPVAVRYRILIDYRISFRDGNFGGFAQLFHFNAVITLEEVKAISSKLQFTV
jgi:hypothetical protein